MTGYTIAAIPTLYRGRMYRSRLEARWAAFFDRVGWAYEYEPFDMGSWSPDFLLTNADVLVEVKPVNSYEQAIPTAQKINSHGKNLLIVGVSPASTEEESSALRVGWLKTAGNPISGRGEEFFEAIMFWLWEERRPNVFGDLLCSDGKFIWTMLSGAINLNRFNSGRHYREYTELIWADACNAVQWEPTS